MWIISQRMMPPIAIVFPIFLLYVCFGWVDTYQGLILLYTAFNLPYVIWMMRGYIDDIPLELEESALVDGCSALAGAVARGLPHGAPGLFATAVFTFVFAWNDFIFALVLTRTEVITFPVQVTHYFGGQSNFWSKIAAMSVLGTLPVFIAVTRRCSAIWCAASRSARSRVRSRRMAEVRIAGLHKRYGPVQAVRGIDLDIPDGEFTVLVGPSGCGKSTLLRTIAGLEEVEQGTIEIGGEVVNDMRPRDRDVAMVFQNYALYPYMTVFEQHRLRLAGARHAAGRRSTPRVQPGGRDAGHRRRCSERYPRQLSGGQRQRVAIGRAIVRNPRVFLFDEPLSNLDAQLRDEMRSEIKRLHQEIATTMIYVTHDQIEAMTLADRIVLMRDGRIEQQGAPLDLFERPASLFVAGFLGSPKMNFLQGRLARSRRAAIAIELGDGVPSCCALPPGRSPQRSSRRRADHSRPPARACRARRPERRRRPACARLETTIELVQPTGSRSYASFRLADQPVLAELQAHDVGGPGERITVDLNLPRATIFDPETGRAL